MISYQRFSDLGVCSVGQWLDGQVARGQGWTSNEPLHLLVRSQFPGERPYPQPRTLRRQHQPNTDQYFTRP